MANNLPTLVLGASEKQSRYSNRAVKNLLRHGHQIYALGKRPGKIQSVQINTAWPQNHQFHTITLYLNPTNQKEYYQNIINMQPERVIFNPGSENPELEQLLKNANIKTLRACTLVLLNTGQYV